MPGPSSGGPFVFAVTTIGVADPATRFTCPIGLIESQDAELAVLIDTVPEPLAVT